MTRLNIVTISLSLLALFSACSKNDQTDTQKPTIDLSFEGAFPTNCDTIYFGEPFTFRALFSDNFELGSFSIDIHHNFDHHSHSTEVTVCQSDPNKEPVNPFVLIQDHAIPEGSMGFETQLSIQVPSSGGCCEYDEGDYHLFISLTDKAGWSTQKGLTIKMLRR